MRQLIIFSITWLAACLLFLSPALAQHGSLRLFSSVEDVREPVEWAPVRPGTRQPVMNSVSGWRTVQLPVGRYDILVKPVQKAGYIRLGPITINSGTRTEVDVKTGLRLEAPQDAGAIVKWFIARPSTNRSVAEIPGNQSFIPLETGRYDLYVERAGDRNPIPFGTHTVSRDKVTTVTLNSGVELFSDSGAPPPKFWSVVESTRGEIVAQTEDTWGFTLLPPGHYRIEVPIDRTMTATSISFVVTPGEKVRVNIADLGIGYLRLGAMFPPDLRLLFGGDAFLHLLEIDDDTFDIGKGKSSNGELFGRWLKTGRAVFETAHGSLSHRTAGEITAGEILEMQHDLDELTSARSLARFAIDTGGTGTCIDRLTVADQFANEVFLTELRPDTGTRYLAPGGARLRLLISEIEVKHGPILPGEEHLVSIDCNTAGQGGIDVAIETPGSGTVVSDDVTQITVIGHASTATRAGVTQLYLVIDTSGSTEDSSGADLDNDGTQESILEVEIAAALDLIDALAKAEATGPGTAFAVSIVGFGDLGRTLVAPVPMTHAEAVDKLKGQIGALTVSAHRGGSTFYDRALNAALRTAEDAGLDGPGIILLITDGKPSQNIAAYDAAARAGQRDFIVHTIGLGADFGDARNPKSEFPPASERGADILATMAALGAPGGQTWTFERPSDVVRLVESLPVTDRADAAIASLQIINATTGAEASVVDIKPDGSFEATVPVSLAANTSLWMNRIVVTAEGVSGATATDEVELRVDGLSRDEVEALVGNQEPLEEEIAALQESLANSQAQAIAVTEDRDRVERENRSLIERLANAEKIAEANADESSALAEKSERDRTERERDARTQRERTARAEREAREAETKVAEIADTLAKERKARSDRERTLREVRQTMAALTADLDVAQTNTAQCRHEQGQCTAELEKLLFVETAEGIQIPLAGDLLFETDEAALTQKALELLTALKPSFENRLGFNILIQGHTDDRGSALYNLDLSKKRAGSVALWLLNNVGIGADQIEVRGIGEAKPIDDNSTAVGRQRNRRVEILFLR